MSFKSDMDKIQKDIQARADKALRASIFTMTSEVISGTPVDTGRAKGNWQASIGKAETSELNKTDISGGATIAKAGEAVSLALGEQYYLTNNLPYIGVLEFVPGFTKKQEAGWVRSAVQRFVPNLEKNLKAENI